MTTAETRTHQNDTRDELSKDELFHLLSNQRRRDALRYLNGHDGPVDMRDLAERIAAWEHDKPVAQLRSKERQRVYIALYQTHLPTLDDHDVTEYNRPRGVVRRTDLADRLDPYLDTGTDENADGEGSAVDAPRPRRPSIRHSLGVVALGAVTLAIGWTGLLPALLLLGLTWIALFAALSRPQPTGLMNGTPLTER